MKAGKYVQCANCGNELYRPPKRLKAKMHFCNNDCKSQHFRKAYQVTCVVCGNDFEKVPAEQKRYPVHCCSVECRSEYNNKRMSIQCENCGQNLVRPPSQIKDKNFCSTECHDEFQDQKIQVKCRCCGKPVWKSPVYINRTTVHFCSIECSGKYCCHGNGIELLFEDCIKNLGLNYERNNRSVLWDRVAQHNTDDRRYKCELDFYFPDIEYAVEINGFTHHSPIYGDKRVNQQKERDSRKRRMCKQAGIKLRTVWIKDPSVEVMTRKFKTVVREIKGRLSNE